MSGVSLVADPERGVGSLSACRKEEDLSSSFTSLDTELSLSRISVEFFGNVPCLPSDSDSGIASTHNFLSERFSSRNGLPASCGITMEEHSASCYPERGCVGHDRNPSCRFLPAPALREPEAGHGPPVTTDRPATGENVASPTTITERTDGSLRRLLIAMGVVYAVIALGGGVGGGALGAVISLFRRGASISSESAPTLLADICTGGVAGAVASVGLFTVAIVILASLLILC
ncbi:MAG: hypothetical protein OXF02_05870 [Simkaniaceae bacterium]|nr:hypothetical protein [Simkaniaceae bacterium]